MEGVSKPVAVTVAVVDDDAIVRDWVRRSLAGTDFRVVGEANTGAEALRLVERRHPALVLIDYRLPDMPGTVLLRRLRRAGNTVPVLVITAAPEQGLNEAVLEAGGQGVVLKRGEPQVLLAALRAVAGGRGFFDPQHPKRPAGYVPLSVRELEVLRLAAEGGTNAEIATRLGVSAESVKTYLSRTFAKLQARNRTEAVQRARDQGLL